MKKVIVVTGASSGMGREFALQISQKEKVDEIWVIARTKERLEDLQKSTAAKIVPIPMDLTDREKVRECYVSRLEEEKPEVKILANCAGFGIFDHTENIDTDILTNMIDLNVTALVALTVSRTMRSRALPGFSAGSVSVVSVDTATAFTARSAR